MENIEKLNETFETATPQEILSWALKTYGSKAALSSSFGGQSACLIHMAVKIDPKIPILFINTGFLFKETIAFAESLKKQFNLNLKEFKATPAQIAVTMKNLQNRKDGSGICCDESKVDGMQRALEGVGCWIAGLRRNQASTRKNIKIVEEYRTGLVKVHPLANWTGKQIYGYMKENNLPFHPLWEKGYTSIGCEPCTRVPIPGQDERSGRWAGSEKTECGIHTFLEKKN